MRRGRWTVGLLGPLIALLAGCGAESDGAEAVVATQVDTIGGVEQITYVGEGRWGPGSGWRVDPDRSVEIGTLDGADAYVFGQIAGVVVGGDGRIYVADDQAKEVRIFTPDGEFVSRFGRAGEGPGEFASISGLGSAPEEGIAALDGMRNLVSLFGPDGGFQRSFRLERPYQIIRNAVPLHFDEQGRFHDLTPLSSTAAGVDSTGVMRYSPAGAVEQKVLLWAHEPRQLTIMEGSRPMASLSVPFTARPSAAIDSRGRSYTTLGEEYRIAVLSPSGDTLRVLRRQVALVPLAPARRDSARARLVERYTRVAGAEPRHVPPIPEQLPAILGLHIDETDHLWVLRPTRDAGAMMTWDVFDPDGAFLGEVQHPTMHVMHIGEETIAGVVHDEMQVPKVRVVPLARE